MGKLDHSITDLEVDGWEGLELTQTHSADIRIVVDELTINDVGTN